MGSKKPRHYGIAYSKKRSLDFKHETDRALEQFLKIAESLHLDEDNNLPDAARIWMRQIFQVVANEINYREKSQRKKHPSDNDIKTNPSPGPSAPDLVSR